MAHGWLLLFFIGVMSTGTSAQTVARRQGDVRDTVMTAGARYDAGVLHRLLFGGEYRDLWATPIRVPVLDMQATGGGLTPTTAGGGFQTKSLRFRGNDGLRYGFRSIDKDPDVLPPGFEGTLIEDLVQDQISSAHPAGPAVAAFLMRMAGVLHTDPHLVVLPDDPALGEFRERFAGTLGFFEERAITDHAEPFAGASEIVDSDSMFALVQRGPDNRVDAPAFLAARLFDILIGDWDRHRGQWSWARFGDENPTFWVPVPEDRDQAFVRYDGLLLSLGRQAAPQLVKFGDRFPGMFGLTWNGRELDRRFLVELEAPVWDSVATEMQHRLTDAVIDSAVAKMPYAYREIDGRRMSTSLKSRRDRLRDAARQFYELLSHEVALHGTDMADLVTVQRHEDRSVEVTLGTGAEPYFRRRFLPGETSEIRVYLHGGDDRVITRGNGSGMTLRFIGGPGDDLVVDSSRAGGVRFYADDGDRVEGPTSVRVDRRTFVLPPKRRPTELPPRDWGAMFRGMPWASLGPDVGFFVGGGAYRTRYGFRHLPFASKIQFRAGYSTGARTGRLDLSARWHRSNSKIRGELDVYVSGIEVMRYYGMGNETIAEGPDEEFYRVNHTQYSVNPSLVVPMPGGARLSSGPVFRYSSTIDQPGRFLETMPGLYGTGGFGHVGWRSRLTLDTRDVPAAATRGVRVDVGANLFPKFWDVLSAYGEVHGTASTYLSAVAAPLRPTLALRVGGKKLWGVYPFQDAAFIGDASSVRLGRQNRYGGDAAAFANAELRVQLGQVFIILPGHIGLLALGDLGRVYLEGEESNRWHNAFGGGVWISFLGPANTVSVTLARSEVGTNIDQRTSLHIQGGFAF